jgi:chaperonin cofactor prefoldin|tara:strand:+ start:431 stop:706 length:276 start_codon:yes stop_codon:yes gene_type:complete
MSEEQKEATVVFNDKKIPMSQLSFQTQRNMQRLSQLQNRVSDLQEQLAEAQVLLKDYGSKVNAALEEAASREVDEVVETSEGKPWEDEVIQ